MTNVAQDVFGELLETAKTAGQQIKQAGPGQIAQTALGQITGAKPKTQDAQQEGKQATSLDKLGDQGIETAQTGNQINPQKMAQLKKQDESQKAEGLAKTRAELTRMKMKRYQEIQTDIERVEKQKEQTIPEYEAGKPGGPRTFEEKAKMIEKQEKEAKEQQNQALPQPSSKQSRGMFPGTVIKQKTGTQELGKIGPG